MTFLSLTSSVRGAECVASLVVRPFTELSGIASTVASFGMSVVVANISVCTMFRRIAPGTRRDSAFNVPSEWRIEDEAAHQGAHRGRGRSARDHQAERQPGVRGD